MERKNVWKTWSEEQVKAADAFAREYMDFLDNGKTERECVDTLVNQIEKAGYRELNELVEKGEKVKPGDKVYAVNMNKCLLMYQIGKQPMRNGMNLLGAHIDSPRMDVKQNPLFEEENIAYLDTHYYGGIKKYQWVALPLALHGVVVKKDGTTVETPETGLGGSSCQDGVSSDTYEGIPYVEKRFQYAENSNLIAPRVIDPREVEAIQVCGVTIPVA